MSDRKSQAENSYNVEDILVEADSAPQISDEEHAAEIQQHVAQQTQAPAPAPAPANKKKKAKIGPDLFRDRIEKWLLGKEKFVIKRPELFFQVSGNQVNTIEIVDAEKKIYRTVDDIGALIRVAAQAEIVNYNDDEHADHAFLKPKRSQIDEIYANVSAQITRSDNFNQLQLPTKLIGYMHKNMDTQPYVKVRIPYLYDWRSVQEAQKESHRLDPMDQQFGSFLTTIKTHFADYQDGHSTMWEILCAFVGRLICEDDSSRELIYWHGRGGDGKSKFFEWLARKLEGLTLTMRYDEAVNPFASGLFENKRLLVMEEAPPGNFLTNTIKTLAGADRIQSMRKGKDSREIKNHLCLVILSNFTPSCKDEGSYLDRLRYLDSLPRKDKKQSNLSASDIFQQLDDDWPILMTRCIATYAQNFNKIPENDADTLADLIEDTMAATDEWIDKHLEYSAGMRIDARYLQKIFEQQDRDQKNGTSFAAIKNRIITRLSPGLLEVGKEIQIKRTTWKNRKQRPTITNVGFKIKTMLIPDVSYEMMQS